MKLLNAKEAKLRKFYLQIIKDWDIFAELENLLFTKMEIVGWFPQTTDPDPEVLKLICKGNISEYSIGCMIPRMKCQICGEDYCDKDECFEKSLASIPIDKLP